MSYRTTAQGNPSVAKARRACWPSDDWHTSTRTVLAMMWASHVVIVHAALHGLQQSCHVKMSSSLDTRNRTKRLASHATSRLRPDRWPAPRTFQPPGRRSGQAPSGWGSTSGKPTAVKRPTGTAGHRHVHVVTSALTRRDGCRGGSPRDWSASQSRPESSPSLVPCVALRWAGVGQPSPTCTVGVIRGFRADVDPILSGLGTSAYVTLNVVQVGWRGVRTKLRSLPGAVHIALVGGESM